MTTAEEIHIIFCLVVFLCSVKVIEVVTNLIVALLSKRGYRQKYLQELEENSENNIELLRYKYALKHRMFEAAKDAFRQPFEENRRGDIDSYELREKYIAVYNQFSEECQLFEIDELQKMIDELYATLLSKLPEL